MFPAQLRQQSGFTLIEALVASALMATALVTVAHLASIGIRQSTNSMRALTALAAAQGKLEQLLAGTLTAGSGDQTGEVLLQWTVAPSVVGSALLSVRVCAYASLRADGPADACVATFRGLRP